MPTDLFSAPTRRWFEASFEAPTAAQRAGWPAIARGEHTLLLAPTGSGKTLAAFLVAIDRLARLPANAAPGARVVYVSPLVALAHDIDRNLRAPLEGVRRTAERDNLPVRTIDVDVRTGDTPASERRRQAVRPRDIVVTTPESLYLLVGSRARETLRSVDTVIVDEVHAVAGTKRGAHLALTLERLSELTEREPQRIGLSATVEPPDEVARFLAGSDREVSIVDASAPPALDLRVVVPVPDMERPPPPPDGADDGERGLWPAIYPRLVELIRENRSTIVFVNSRGLCERLARRLNDVAGEPMVRAHHGSVSRAQRAAIEGALVDGTLRGIVATSSLELGIDMGAVDLVILVESPGSAARGLQRIGRAGHHVGATSAGRVFPKFRGDLLECAAVAERMLAGELEPLAVPRNALDVLAQQIVAMCADEPRTVQDLGRTARRAYPYRDLGDGPLTGVLEMLTGRYPSSELADLRPRLSWDRARDLISPRRGAALLARLNAGTIPDRGLYAVHAGEGGPRVGELDEEMVFESRAGDTFTLGASTWRVEEVTRDRVIVSPAPGEPGKLPFWHGEGPGRPVELGRALGRLVRTLGDMEQDAARDHLRRRCALDELAAQNLVHYLADQRAHTGCLPTDQAITIERFRDEIGDWRVCILTPLGARVHAPWSVAVQGRLGAGAQVMYTDDGVVVRFADGDEPPPTAELVPDPGELEELVTGALADSALFAALFRENAARALLLPRRRPDRRNPLWSQRLKARQLLAAVRDYPDFPIALETYRQCLRDVFDVPSLAGILTDVRAGRVRVDEVETPSASPFARALVFAYAAAYIYEQDAPVAERRAQALTLDRGLLRELLGEEELRELIDPRVLALVEDELQGRADGFRARDADDLHDLLRRAGDLSAAEIGERADGDPAEMLARLERERRAAPVEIAGQTRWIAEELAGLYRSALGVSASAFPHAHAAPGRAPLADLAARLARARGPFRAADLAARYELRTRALEPVLASLEAEGALVSGAIRPGGDGVEWCHAEVLRRLKRRTLALLRDEVAAVPAAAFARFLPRWHGIAPDGRPAPEVALERAIAALEGLPLPWSSLSGAILPARVPGFRPEMLDRLAATGELVWAGRGALGQRDGRVVLCRRDRAPLVFGEPPAYDPPTDVHAAILEHLAARGASFLVDLEGAARRARPELSSSELDGALWDLVWAGRITNDTFQPLRSIGRTSAVRSRRRGLRPIAGGRWFAVEELGGDGSDTERAHALATMLLGRYGIVSREAAVAEGIPGGFGTLYRVLRAMEEAGAVRRGHFAAGLAGAQFALPGAADRLRAARPDAGPDRGPDIAALAAVDPAQPYGALLPWPETEGGGPRRVPGAWVILADGAPAVFVGPGGRRLWTFPGIPDGVLAAALAAVRALPRAGRRRSLVVEEVDGVPVTRSRLWQPLVDAGFERDYRGLTPRPGG